MKIKFKKIDKEAVVPTQATTGSVGFDLYAIKDSVLAAGAVALIGTGLALEIPDNMEVQIRSRSSMAMKKLIVLNSPGTIDSDYRGEIKVMIANLNNSTQFIKEGDRIAQMVFARRELIDLVQVDELGETERGNGGFGSTGR